MVRLSERKKVLEKAVVVRTMQNVNLPMEERLEIAEKYLQTFPQKEVPLEESYGYNLYVREIVMPAGSFAIGRVHKYEHLSIMIEGELIMWTEFDDVVHLKGYNKVIAPAGIRRAGMILQDTKWITAHGVDPLMNPEDMVPSLTVSNYAEYTKFKRTEMLSIPGSVKLTESEVAQAQLEADICRLRDDLP